MDGYFFPTEKTENFAKLPGGPFFIIAIEGGR